MQGSFPALPPSLMMFLGQNIKGGGYMNSITDLLDLEDNDVIISNIDVQGQTKVLTLETVIVNKKVPKISEKIPHL